MEVMKRLSPAHQLKRRISRDADFTKGLRALTSTTEAAWYCNLNGIAISAKELFFERGRLCSDGIPTWSA